ncbi:hypothetical protein J7E73_07425 [Paenibacillus albidus]|uniref:hypothetical protein n=1 Tax=Paenibacillus albidus TaxID=2041023 RepID=UPI001BE8406C|nr:hypothetical protein [Paenibacillus albidus]MBT2288964.1 hypothetical protein [Paenibacillus albidus]
MIEPIQQLLFETCGPMGGTVRGVILLHKVQQNRTQSPPDLNSAAFYAAEFQENPVLALLIEIWLHIMQPNRSSRLYSQLLLHNMQQNAATALDALNEPVIGCSHLTFFRKFPYTHEQKPFTPAYPINDERVLQSP